MSSQFNTLISHYLIYLDLDPTREHHSGDTGAFKSEAQLFFANRAYLSHANGNELQEIKDFYGKIPHTLWISSDHTQSKDLATHSGYAHTATYPIMLADLAHMHVPPIRDSVTIKQLNKTPQELEEWLTVLSAAYKLDKDEFRKFLKYFQSTPAWDKIQFFTAYLNGIPAATSMTIDRGTIAGLHWVGTIPEYRGHGLGSLISSYPFQALRCKGITQAILLASDMGKPIYEKLGFTTVGMIDVYKPGTF